MAVEKVQEPESRLKAKDKLIRRQQNYIVVFNKEAPVDRAVLEDLAQYCFAHKSTFDADPRVHAFQEGRRDVWLRISQHLNLSAQQLWELYSNSKF